MKNRSRKSSIGVDFHHQSLSNTDLFLHHKACFAAKTQNSCLDFLYTHVLVCSEQLWLELQQTKDIEIVHQMQKKSNLTRLGFYVV